jgi:hypothetical protein
MQNQRPERQSHTYLQSGDLKIVFINGLWCKFSKRLFGYELKVQTAEICKPSMRREPSTKERKLEPDIVGEDQDYLLSCEFFGKEMLPQEDED